MLRGTCYYNKKIKVENVAESAKIVTNVHTFRVPFISGMFVNEDSTNEGRSPETSPSGKGESA